MNNQSEFTRVLIFSQGKWERSTCIGTERVDQTTCKSIIFKDQVLAFTGRMQIILLDLKKINPLVFKISATAVTTANTPPSITLFNRFISGFR
jgi:hypothetical protein